MTTEEIVIKVENLSRRYRIGLKEEAHDSIVAALLDLIKSPLHNYRKYRSLYKFEDNKPVGEGNTSNDTADIIWALRNVSFEVKRGEVLGIIGSNGAGKSTLLKILSKITQPTSGRAQIRGRVSSLLEVGTGFHPELTGRENIYLNGTVLGMTKKEVERKFEDIVDFSGVERFIDTPVKRYSSGMQVRLAFSVAAHLEPEILLVDEVLAVGDAAFQKKCLGKMSEVSQQGRTVLFVSHQMAAVEHLCNRVIVLESGKVKIDAAPNKAIGKYLDIGSGATETNDLASVPRTQGFVPVIQKIEFIDERGQSVTTVPIGATLTVHIHYKHTETLKEPYFGLQFQTQLGVKIFWLQTRLQKGQLNELPPAGIIACHIPRLQLMPGMYFISPGCGSQTAQLDFLHRACQLQVTEADVFGTGRLPLSSQALFLVDADWKIIRKGENAIEATHTV